jgi:predicted  nucleic acid-binding Zn-ribbon protein/predicted RNA-binding Zn-ribbon protein involved in translation (DUF1610 family)
MRFLDVPNQSPQSLPSESILANMIEALGLEVQAIKKRGGSTSIEVRGGEYRGCAEGHFLYAFPVTEDIYLRDESPIRVVVGQEEIDGVVVSFGDRVVVVALERDLGPKIAVARLIADNSFLVERLKTKLEDVLDGTAAFNREKADQAIGEREHRSGETEVDDALLVGGERLDPDKERAIAKALGSEVTYLWGPPGTGKTTVLARIVQGYYRAGYSILVVSNTNVAVDTALEMIAERLQSDAEFQKGAVLRYGPVVKEELDAKYGDQVILDRVVDRLGRKLREEQQHLEATKASVVSEAESCRKAIAELEALESTTQEVQHLRASLQHAKTREHSARARLESLGQEIRRLQSDLERARTTGSVRRFFAGLNPSRLKREISEAEVECTAQEDALTALKQELSELDRKLAQSHKSLTTMSQRVKGHPPLEECQQRLKDYEARIEKLGQRIQEIQKELDALRDEILRNCRVLATTVYRTYLKGQVERSFDVVVVDEASMLALPMVYYASGLAKRQVVVTGDFRQLPPIIMSEEPQAEEWLKPDVFRKSGIADAVERREDPESLCSLGVQYRMHEDICDVTNALFYSDRPLRTAKEVHQRPEVTFPLGNFPLLYVDTSPYNPWAALPLGSFTRYNVLHALLVRNIACHLWTTGYLREGHSLGIVSPYTGQARLIQGLLNERLPRGIDLVAATVHRFQGNEKDTILVDLVDSIGARPSKFMKAVSTEQDGARLLNVAVSRARRNIILVANFQYLQQRVGPDSIVCRLLDHLQENGRPLDVGDLLPLGPEDWLDALKPISVPAIEFDPSAAGAFNEGTFYPAFTQDVRRADDSIVIFSPFLTEDGAGRWIDLLRAKTSDGVRVRLVTRPPGKAGGVLDHGLEERISHIAKLGIVVDHRARMHEKFAIIDKAILWHGSLNILSHRDTEESMLRIPSEAACKEVARFVSSPLRRQPGEQGQDIDLAARENPDCAECSRPMVWKTGRYGVYFECFGCGEKISTRRTAGAGKRPVRRSGGRNTSRAKKTSTGATGVRCPECGKPMVRRVGTYGPFMGCSGYPKCRHTESIS